MRRGLIIHLALIALAAARCSGGSCGGERDVAERPASPAVRSAPRPDPPRPDPPTEQPSVETVALDASRVQAGLFDGSLFVDLTRPAGSWILRDGAEIGRRGPSEPGVVLSDDPLVLRLAAADVAGRCVTLLAACPGGCQVAVGPVGAKGRRARVSDEPTLVEWRCLDDEAEPLDLKVQADGPATLAGVWLARPGSSPPAAIVSASACSAGGVTLEPGTMVSTTRLVEPGESVGLRVSGPDVAAGDVTVTVRHDTGGDRELAVDAEGFTAEVENDREECRAVRFVASRAPGPGESACLELVSHRAPPAGAPAGREASLDAVVVVMTDTMRADLYSVERSQFNVPMETLSELFSRSTVFTGATAHASYTKPSVASILTGLYPEQHGALGRKAPVADEVTLLPEILEDNGVTTVAFLSNYFFDPVFGLREGWTEEHSVDPYKAARDDDVVVTEFERWCAEGVPEGPLFVYIHLMGAHAPYSPPRDYRREFLGGAGLSRRIVPRHTAKLIADLIAGRQKKLDRRETAQMRRLYRADAAYHDDVMGRLLAALESSGLAERALLIYTSDHGEEFYEHGRIGHGTGLWYEQVRVPLVVREPGQADGRLVSTTAGHVDVAPTVLSTLGVEPPAPLPGRDLLSIAAEPPTSSRGLLMQSWMGRWGIQVGPFKLLRRPQDERLFVVRTAGEDEVRPDENPVLHELLRVHMAWAYHDLGAGAPGGAAADSELDPELENRLEALGYVMD